MKLPLYILDIDESQGDETKVFACGLVTQPAIERNWMTFGKKENFKVLDEQRRYVAGFLMVSDQPIYRRDDDGREYYVAFPAKSIEKIVNKLSRSGKPLTFNTNHNDKEPVKCAHLVQHFIIDSTMGIKTPEGHDPAPDGSWFGVVKIDDEKYWNEYVKSGKLQGFSVEGFFNDIPLLEADKEVYEELKNNLLNMNENKFKAIEKFFGTKTANKLKHLFEDETPPPTELATEALEDGSGSIKGTIAEGEAVVMVAADGTEGEVADGDYKLASGKMITCSGGKITKVEDAAPTEDDVVMSAEKVQEAIQSALSTQAADFNKQIKALLDAHNTSVAANKENFAAIAEGLTVLAKLGEAAPAPKDDPRNKHLEAKQKNFNRIADITSKIKK